MKNIITSASICLNDKYGFVYRVCRLDYILNEDDSFSYIFTPDYSVIDLLSNDLFQGIPGLNLDLRKEVYIRENSTPVFISERTPSENREELFELLAKCDLKYLNRLEWLIRTSTRYSGDNFYVIRYEPKATLFYEDIIASENRASLTINNILNNICLGNIIVTNDFSINDANRKGYYSLLMPLFEKEKLFLINKRVSGIKESAKYGIYRGRKPILIDKLKFEEVAKDFQSKKITQKEALEILKISKSTFYRRLK
jgi:hypothetical protein